MTLTEFLLARITEDEAVAREAADQRVEVGGFYVENRRYARAGDLNRTMRLNIADEDWAGPSDVIEMYPVRLFAECEAKRRIVTRHSFGAPWENSQDDCFWSYADITGPDTPCGTLRDLALPYADHPDYRQEWRP